VVYLRHLARCALPVLAWLLDFRGIYDNALYCGLVGIMQSTGIGDANNSLGIAHEKDNNILLQGIMTTSYYKE
jgi:hypothetical protein